MSYYYNRSNEQIHKSINDIENILNSQPISFQITNENYNFNYFNNNNLNLEDTYLILFK